MDFHTMSWWTTESWQTTSDKIPPCHNDRQLLDGGIVASSSLGLTRKKEQLLFSISAAIGLHHVHSTWASTFVLAALVATSSGSTLYCLIAIVFLLLCLKLKTCGRRPSWHDIHIQKVTSQRRTHFGPSHDFAQTHGLYTHSIVSAALEWDKRLLWLLNSMRGLL